MVLVSIEKILSTRDDSKTILLSNAEFEIAKSSILSIVGKNGTGKTTFIKSLTGLLDKRFYTVIGKVIFEGRDILSMSKEELKLVRQRKIKYVFQDAKNSFNQLKKIGHYFDVLNCSSEEMDEILDYFLLPNSIELFRLYPYEISGGMAQRVSLSLALLAKPSLVILDEPTSGIDSAISNLFLLKLKEYVKNNSSSILLVTQDFTFAEKISDKIAMLSDRKLSDFLSPEEFFNSNDIMQKNDLLPSYFELHK